jgi:hypothetical protein
MFASAQYAAVPNDAVRCDGPTIFHEDGRRAAARRVRCQLAGRCTGCASATPPARSRRPCTTGTAGSAAATRSRTTRPTRRRRPTRPGLLGGSVDASRRSTDPLPRRRDEPTYRARHQSSAASDDASPALRSTRSSASVSGRTATAASGARERSSVSPRSSTRFLRERAPQDPDRAEHGDDREDDCPHGLTFLPQQVRAYAQRNVERQGGELPEPLCPTRLARATARVVFHVASVIGERRTRSYRTITPAAVFVK